MNWNYVRTEQERLKPGDYRVEVVDVEEKTSSKGNPMIVVTVKPNGSAIRIKQYIVKNDYFNRNMTQFFDSFNIEDGDFNFLTWIGAVGAARLKEDDLNPEYLKIAWWIDKKRAEKLPEWKGAMPERQTVTSIEDDDNPFDDLEEAEF